MRISGASETDIEERDKSRQRSIRGCKIVQFMQIFALQITNSMANRADLQAALSPPLASTPLSSHKLYNASALSYASAETAA